MRLLFEGGCYLRAALNNDFTVYIFSWNQLFRKEKCCFHEIFVKTAWHDNSYRKNSVKTMVLQQKVLNSYFDESFFQWERISHFSTLYTGILEIMEILFEKIMWKHKANSTELELQLSLFARISFCCDCKFIFSAVNNIVFLWQDDYLSKHEVIASPTLAINFTLSLQNWLHTQ